MNIVYEDSLTLPGEFISVSKPAQVLKAVYNPAYDTVHGIELLDQRDFYLAHSPYYVDRVFDLSMHNGFGSANSEYLTQIVAANSCLYTAVRYSLLMKKPVAALCSGFHHAKYGSGGGFCTFNGLLIAILKIRATYGRLKNVLIIDGDGHYGDGTDDIIRELDLRGIHNLTHRLDGKKFGLNPLGWQDTISSSLKHSLVDWDLVIYQAGADCHEADDFGAGYLTDLEWEERDKLVFSTCKELGVPIVWNLAGGYSNEKTIELHASTFSTARQVYEPRHRQQSPVL